MVRVCAWWNASALCHVLGLGLEGNAISDLCGKPCVAFRPCILVFSVGLNTNGPQWVGFMVGISIR